MLFISKQGFCFNGRGKARNKKRPGDLFSGLSDISDLGIAYASEIWRTDSTFLIYFNPS